MSDRILQSYLSRIHNDSLPPPINDTGQTHTVYYRSQFSAQYKTDERILRNIISTNTECINPAVTLKLVIYYPRHTTSNIILGKTILTVPASHLNKLTSYMNSNASWGTVRPPRVHI